MLRRRLGVIWAAFAAAALGVLIAALTSGSEPSIVVLAALVAVPAAVTVFVRLSRRSSHRGRRPSAHPTAGETFRPDQRAREADWDAVGTICGALDGRQLDWLRSNDFVTPWLGGRARPVIELAPFVAQLVEVRFDRDIQRALLGLSDAIEQFVAFYGDNTSADPLLLGDEWRFFEWDDLGPAEERVPAGGHWGGRATHLHELAARLADSYEAFTKAAVRDPRSHHRIKVLV